MWLATRPLQVTTLIHPGGRPASSKSRAMRSAVSGVLDAGLRTTGQPAATAGAILWHTRLSGKLNGEIAPTTPIGTRLVKPSLPTPADEASRGTISPVNVRASAAEKRIVSTARCVSTRAVVIGLADSSEIDWANSSSRSDSSCAARSRTAARSWAGGGPPRWRSSATAMARSRCSVSQAGTAPTGRPS